MKSVILIFLISLSLTSWIYGQSNPWYPEEDTLKKTSQFWHSQPDKAKFFGLNGLYESNGFAGWMTRFGYGKKHWQGSFDVFGMGNTVKWDSADQNMRSQGRYSYWGFGASGRVYMSNTGRNAFAEIGAGTAAPRLAVTYGDGKEAKDKWKMQFLSFGAGWRLGVKPRGLFGEIGYRGYMVVHKMPFLYTDLLAQPQIGKDAPALQYHIWYIRRFRLNHQLSVGIGYSF